jgi:hypothetical protein
LETVEVEVSDKEIQRLWIEEALRRDAELDAGVASSRDAEDVFRDVRALIESRFSDNDRGVILSGEENI